jgi:hypothetical protein
MKRLRDYILEAETAATQQPTAPAQPQSTPAGTKPFTPNQTMDPQQAAAANKAAMEFVAQLTDKVKTLAQTQADVLKTVTNKPVSAPVQEAQLDEGEGLFGRLVSWVKQTLAENPLIELGLRIIPNPTQPILVIMDVISAVKSGNFAEAGKAVANLVPGLGPQIAQAISAGQAVASGDIAGAAQQTASAAGLGNVAQAIGVGKAVASGDTAGAATQVANAAGLKDVSAGIQTAQAAGAGDYAGAATAAGLGNVANGINTVNKGREIARAVTETTELDRILAIARHQR